MLIDVPCTDCGKGRRCDGYNAMHRVASLAFAKNAPTPECPFHTPDYFRGIDGVLAHSPRPSRLYAAGQR
jgi:hypothetical protein